MRDRKLRTLGRNVLKRALLMAAGLAFALVLAEGIIRMLGLSPAHSPMQSWLEEDPVLPFRPAANRVFNDWNATREFRFEIRTNSRGFRDEDRAIQKPAGTFRIVALGDSYTWGYGTPADKTWPALLQRRLSERHQGRRSFEVINLGIGRFWPEPERRLLETEALLYSPDVLVVLMVDNDVLDTHQGVRGVTVSNGYLVRTRARELLGDFGVGLAAHSHLVRLLVAQLPDGGPVGSEDWREIYKENGFFEDAWREIEREYERMLAVSRARGVEILFARAPSGGMFIDGLDPAPDLSYPGRRLTRWAKRRSAHFVDCWKAIEAAGGNARHYWPRDGHPNPEGYSVIANVILRALSAKGLLR